MELLNFLFSRFGVISKINIDSIGRMTAGWFSGQFFYNHPSEMNQVANEKLLGYLSHYGIGISLSFPFVFLWNIISSEPTSPLIALIYGIATTSVSWFFVYPSMGFGLLGLRSPDGLKASFSSLCNHLFYGTGLAIAIALTG